MSLSLVHLIKNINKPLYYGFYDKNVHKTNIVYFKNKEDAHQCKVFINNYYETYRKSPLIEELKFDKVESENRPIFKIHSMDENYINNYIYLGNLESYSCYINESNNLICNKNSQNTNVDYNHMYFNMLYTKHYVKKFYN